jgi:4-diphosphocytidyl-2-C-methyl-D-erythritol kinase
MTRDVRVLARAKLTLSLRVLGRRPDGFHDLEALVVSLEEPYDAVSLRLRPTLGVALRLSGRGSAEVPADDTNLAVRAARMLLDTVEEEAAGGAWAAAGLEVSLHKGIPPGAGLGGGSADAAATLSAGSRLLGLDLDDDTLGRLGARLGSDVPFCITGGTAWIRGRGEEVDRLPPLGPLPLVVVVPPFALSTRAVYEAWDRLGGAKGERACPPPPAVEDLLPGGLGNDLEPAAEAVEPRLRPFRQAVEAVAARPAVMAGSGSAYVVAAASAGQAAALARDLSTALPGAAVFATRPVTRGIESQGDTPG